MNKSMLTGAIAGIGIATAGGVAGYTFLGQDAQVDEQGSALVIEEGIEDTSSAAQAPERAVAAAQAAPAPRQAAAPEPAPIVEECWEEEVTVQVDPRDDKAIAGTAAGAIIGGAAAKELGDDNDLATAAGAAAGAFFGRRAQRRMQENNTTTTIETRCAPVGTR